MSNNQPSAEALEIVEACAHIGERGIGVDGPAVRRQARAIDTLREKDRAEDKRRIEELEEQVHKQGLQESLGGLCIDVVQGELESAKEGRDRLKAENEELRQTRIIVCQLIQDSERLGDEFVIPQESYGVTNDMIPSQECIEESIADASTPPISDGAECAIFKLVNFVHNKAQIGEFGRVEVPEYWEFDTAFVRIEFPSKEALANQPADRGQGGAQ